MLSSRGVGGRGHQTQSHASGQSSLSLGVSTHPDSTPTPNPYPQAEQPAHPSQPAGGGCWATSRAPRPSFRWPACRRIGPQLGTTLWPAPSPCGHHQGGGSGAEAAHSSIRKASGRPTMLSRPASPSERGHDVGKGHREAGLFLVHLDVYGHGIWDPFILSEAAKAQEPPD